MSAPEAQLSSTQADDLLWRHLKSVPAFRALLRAVEARFYHNIEIPDPVLDLGCGDGHFARMAFDRPLAAGVDPWWGPLNKARRAGVYRLNVQALGHALPFPGETFASVISNSVLEHIPDVQPVLQEAARVLQPGGKLVITMPSHLFTEYLGGAALLRPVGLSDAYRRFFNRISRHEHTDPPQDWARRLVLAGFSIEHWQYYFSRDALRALELGHVQGLPSAVLHALTGHWVLAPWRQNLRRTERWLRPFYEEEPPDMGAYLIMVARKTSRQLPASDNIEVRLPAPRPLPTSEPAAPDQSRPEETHLHPTPAPITHQETVFTFRTAHEEPPAAALPNRGLLAAFLLLTAIFATFTAQSTFSQRLPSPWAGVAWYAVAFLALAASAVLLRRRRQTLLSTATISRRVLLYPLALAFALLAQEQSGASLFGGNPFMAFALWLLATAVAYFALATQSGGAEEISGQLMTSDVHSVHGDDPVSATIDGRLPYATALITSALFLLALLPRLLWLTSHPFILNGIEASIGLDTLAVLEGQIRNPFATSWLSNPTLPLYPASLPLALFGRTVLGVRLLSALVGSLTVPILFLFARRLWGFWFALVASILLAGYHLHVHYSRLGMTNAWDPLLALLLFGSIAVAVMHPTRRSWLLAGLATGLGAYFYTPSHLLPFFLTGLILYAAFLQREFVARHWPHLLAATAVALVVALPQIIFYRANPGLFMERANTLGILQNDWLLQQAAAGRSVGAALADQLWRTLLAFNGSLDTSTSYNPGIPLLRFWPSIFFVLGAGVAFWRLRQLRYALLLIWLSVTLLFGGALLVDAPDSHRLLIATPAAVLLTTAGLFWLGRLGQKAATALSSPQAQPQNRRFLQPNVMAVLLLAILFVAGDLFFYFGQYRNSHRFGDRNSEVAHEVGLYLDSLEGSWQAYFHGPPAMYVTFPTILYLAQDFRPGENLLDVPEASQLAPEAAPGVDLVFIYLPERSAEVNQTAEKYPQGVFLTFDGILANPLFYAYEVPR